VAGGSMYPALRDGDVILTNKLAFGLRLPGTDAWLLRWSEPRRGDVVVFSSPVDGKRLVKRVAGVPGDALGKSSVPPGHYFVMGDGANSLDSRVFGCVPRECILGRVVGER
jgi:signal peptidase I